MQFSPLLCYLVPLRPKYSPQHIILKQPQHIFDVLLTVHLCIILVINQFNAQILFYNKFTIYLYMFRALCAHHQEVKTVLYSIWYHHTYR